MARQIERHLNHVSCNRIHTPKWAFSGDGNGDFEEHSAHATEEVLANYLIYLEEQRQLTLNAIADLYPKEECDDNKWHEMWEEAANQVLLGTKTVWYNK